VRRGHAEASVPERRRDGKGRGARVACVPRSACVQTTGTSASSPVDKPSHCASTKSAYQNLLRAALGASAVLTGVESWGCCAPRHPHRVSSLRF
jgi:hypothetical protein